MYPTEEDPEGEPPNEGTTDRTEEEYECCYMCGKVPCKWIEYGLPVVEEIKTRYILDTAVSKGYVIEHNTGQKVNNEKLRFTSYTMFTYEKFGHVGKGHRIKLPLCVEGKIKEMFPNIDGNYTGFQAAE